MSAGDGLAALNGWIRRRATQRGESPSTLCEHCDRVGEASPIEVNRCAVCAPRPADAQRQAWEVRIRVREAVRAAAGWPRWSR